MCCMHCGRPMLTSVMVGGMLYHPECTHGPSYPTHYVTQPMLTVQHYTVPMDDERVRQIVRDELLRSGLLNSQNA